MKNVVVDEIVKELSKKYNKKEKLIKCMIKLTIKQNHNIMKSKKMIEEFYD